MTTKKKKKKKKSDRRIHSDIYTVSKFSFSRSDSVDVKRLLTFNCQHAIQLHSHNYIRSRQSLSSLKETLYRLYRDLSSLDGCSNDREHLCETVTSLWCRTARATTAQKSNRERGKNVFSVFSVFRGQKQQQYTHNQNDAAKL